MKPARQQKLDPSKVIVDLDALVSEPQTFKWAGKVHVIKPITVETFFKVTQNIAKLDQLRDPSTLTQEMFVNAYTDVFSSVCDTISSKDVETMTIPQRGALLQYILDCIKGQTQTQDYEKKNLPNRGA